MSQRSMRPYLSKIFSMSLRETSRGRLPMKSSLRGMVVESYRGNSDLKIKINIYQIFFICAKLMFN